MSSIPTPPLDPHSSVHSPTHFTKRGKMKVHFMDDLPNIDTDASSTGEERVDIDTPSAISPIKIKTPLMTQNNPDMKAANLNVNQRKIEREEPRNFADVQDHEAFSMLLRQPIFGRMMLHSSGILQSILSSLSVGNVFHWLSGLWKYLSGGDSDNDNSNNNSQEQEGYDYHQRGYFDLDFDDISDSSLTVPTNEAFRTRKKQPNYRVQSSPIRQRGHSTTPVRLDRDDIDMNQVGDVYRIS